MITDEEVEALEAVDSAYEEAMEELQRVWDRHNDRVGGGIHSSQIKALVWLLVAKGVLP